MTDLDDMCARIASLAVDAGLPLVDALAAAGVPDPQDMAGRVEAGRPVTSLEVALVAAWAGRDPYWIIAGWGAQDVLEHFCTEQLPEMTTSQRHGFNATFNALGQLLPAYARDRVLAASRSVQAGTDPTHRTGVRA